MNDNILKMIRPADAVTLISALLGFASIIKVHAGDMQTALILILISVIFDGADGAIARYTGQGVLGANLDSLADVIAFGIAPAFVSYAYLAYPLNMISGLFLVCGILRLARFNVTSKKDGFQGIPITAAGFIAALFILIGSAVPTVLPLLPLVLVILSILMVSTIPYPKIKRPVIVAPLGLLVVSGIISYKSGIEYIATAISSILFAAMCFYLLSPLFEKIRSKNQG